MSPFTTMDVSSALAFPITFNAYLQDMKNKHYFCYDYNKTMQR